MWRYLTGLVCLLSAARGALANEPLRDDFEGPETSFRFAGGDAEHRIERHARVNDQAHAGHGCEAIAFVAGQGRSLYFALNAGQPRIIDELSISLWLKADRAGPQIVARVVLPHTIDPRTKQPAVLFVTGSNYSRPGAWEQLSLADLPAGVAAQARVLRAEIGGGVVVDEREAYLDAVLLNAYAGQGRTAIWLDDLESRGVIGPGFVAGTPDAETSNGPPIVDPAATRPKFARNGDQWTLDERPILVRAVRHQGEPLGYLKSLGFNAVLLSVPPDPPLLKEAERERMWLLAPPAGYAPNRMQPPPTGGLSIDENWDWVLAWDLGDQLGAAHLPMVRAWAGALLRADSRQRRPIIGDAMTDLLPYSRTFDALRHYRLPLGSSLELTDYATWLAARGRWMRPGQPFWATVQTQPNWALSEQMRGLAADANPPTAVTAEQMRLLAYVGIATGARGLVFESFSRLDARDEHTTERALALELLNLELSVLEPWAAAGSFARFVESDNKEMLASLLATEHGSLVVGALLGRGAQFSVGQASGNNVHLVAPGAAVPHGVYEVSPVGIAPIDHERATRGVKVTLKELDLTATVLFSQQPIVLKGVSERIAQIKRRAVELQGELSRRHNARTTALCGRLSTAEVPQLQKRLESARASLHRGESALRSGNLEAAWQAFRQSERPLRIVESQMFAAATKDVRPAVASPLAMDVRTLDLHTRFFERLKLAGLGPNVLPGGDCEDLGMMQQTGWRHEQVPQESVTATAELSDVRPYAGARSLRLVVRPKDAAVPPQMVESAPIWVTTAPVPVRPGHLYRIHGFVRVPAPITGSLDGLLVLDSLGGVSLAARLDADNNWQEFTLFRIAPREAELSVTFALTGLGEAYVDDVTIEPVLPGVPGQPPPGVPFAGLMPKERGEGDGENPADRDKGQKSRR